MHPHQDGENWKVWHLRCWQGGRAPGTAVHWGGEIRNMTALGTGEHCLKWLKMHLPCGPAIPLLVLTQEKHSICTRQKWATTQCLSLGVCHRCASTLGRLCGRGRKGPPPTWPHWGHVRHPANRCTCWWLHLYGILGDADQSTVVGSRSTVARRQTKARGRKELAWVHSGS